MAIKGNHRGNSWKLLFQMRRYQYETVIWTYQKEPAMEEEHESIIGQNHECRFSETVKNQSFLLNKE
jgi:hypothetical protein